jgi:hypothetical protein
MSHQPPATSASVDVNEVVEELDQLGRALFDAAVARVRVRKLEAELFALRAEQQRAKLAPPVKESK